MGETKRERDGEPSVPLQMIVTTGAAYYAKHYLINPCNWVKVYGPPGETIDCTVSYGLEMIGVPDPGDTTQLPSILYPGNGQSYGSDTYSPALNEAGFTWFLVRAKQSTVSQATSELLVGTVYADVHKDPNNSIAKMPTFGLYLDGNPNNDPTVHFEGYNYTTGAPADGLTPCCIYVQADDDPSKSGGVVRVEIKDKTSSAAIVGAPTAHPLWLDVALESDGTAAILIVDAKAEAVPFTIGLPYAEGTNLLGPFTMYFDSFPYVPGCK